MGRRPPRNPAKIPARWGEQATAVVGQMPWTAPVLVGCFGQPVAQTFRADAYRLRQFHACGGCTETGVVLQS